MLYDQYFVLVQTAERTYTIILMKLPYSVIKTSVNKHTPGRADEEIQMKIVDESGR